MQITNTSKTFLDLPGGQRLHPNVPASVHGWAEMVRNPIIAAWVKERILTVAPEPTPADIKDALIERLRQYGIHRSRRASEESLRRTLAEVEQ